MILAGCDVGSLSAEAVIMKDGSILSFEIMKVRPRPEQSADDVMEAALSKAGSSLDDIDYCIMQVMAGRASPLPEAMCRRYPVTAKAHNGSSLPLGP